jgi:hypothetical protein
MARTPRPEPAAIYRCTEAFAIFRNGAPVVFPHDYEVLGSDPILRTHLAHFQPAAEAILRRRTAVEQATAAPGELRAPVLPPATAPEETLP